MAKVGDEDRIMRKRVQEALNEYRKSFTELLQEYGIESNNLKRFDLRAARNLKEQRKCINTSKRCGPIPGVEVGDEFHNRAELIIVGLHHNFVNGIDYMRTGAGQILATSIVNSGRYSNIVKYPNALIYSGEGGNPGFRTYSEPKDQKLERGNLALKNSMEHGSSVRVIRAIKHRERGAHGKTSSFTSYVYDGLYKVVRYCKGRDAEFGKLAFRFFLIRIDGQPKIKWGRFSEVSKRPVVPKDIVCTNDISQGKEKMPIRVINGIDDESPPSFNYVCNTICPDFFEATTQSPRGCDCPDGCSESEPCPCVMKNGGVLPYDDKKRRTNKNSVVYECGPSCKCSSTCKNRVSQGGIQFKLEVFKTKANEWGVRALDYIVEGSFICEFTGEIVRDPPQPLSFPMLSSLARKDRVTVNAAQHGNVGRFVNYSCSPNLVAQSVLYGHDDLRMARVMLFADKDIPPKRELTYNNNNSSVAKLLSK